MFTYLALIIALDSTPIDLMCGNQLVRIKDSELAKCNKENTCAVLQVEIKACGKGGKWYPSVMRCGPLGRNYTTLGRS